MKKNILVLFGGRSPEYSVSLQSAYAVLTHMNKEKYNAVTVGIDPKGNWHLYTGAYDAIPDDTWRTKGPCVPVVLPMDQEGTHCLLTTEEDWNMIPIDAAFPVMHGAYGEDGRLQGALEMAGIPVIGCGMTASALCMDKRLAHQIVSLYGIHTARSVCISCYDRNTASLAERIGYPLYVKPLRAGSSYGIRRIVSDHDLQEAVKNALQYDDTVLLEEEIIGEECGCAILGTEDLFSGVPDRIVLESAYYDYAEKYAPVTSKILCPSGYDAAMVRKIIDTAKTIYQALGCAGFARVDLFVREDGELVFNEVNTIPGFTAHSRYPQMMQKAGISFEQLLDRLIEERTAS